MTLLRRRDGFSQEPVLPPGEPVPPPWLVVLLVLLLLALTVSLAFVD